LPSRLPTRACLARVDKELAYVVRNQNYTYGFVPVGVSCTRAITTARALRVRGESRKAAMFCVVRSWNDDVVLRAS
jgi:hypothetical protein